MPNTLKINPPLYLASTVMACWKCNADMPAVVLITRNNSETQGDAAILSNIRQLPAALRREIQARFPTFKLKHSKTTESEYFANTCPKCGIISGDFFLHSEPDSPFFPTDEAEAAQLTIEELPLSGPVELDAGYGVGLGEIILKNAKMRSSV